MWKRGFVEFRKIYRETQCINSLVNLPWSLFLVVGLQVYWKRTQWQVSFCEFCKILARTAIRYKTPRDCFCFFLLNIPRDELKLGSFNSFLVCSYLLIVLASSILQSWIYNQENVWCAYLVFTIAHYTIMVSIHGTTTRLGIILFHPRQVPGFLTV